MHIGKNQKTIYGKDFSFVITQDVAPHTEMSEEAFNKYATELQEQADRDELQIWVEDCRVSEHIDKYLPGVRPVFVSKLTKIAGEK